MDARKARIVELRYFGGLSIEETAEALKIAPGTLMKDWTLAKHSCTKRLANEFRTIIQLLGEGGLGQVYPAQDNKLGRKVALKFLPSFYTKDKNRLRRFTQEARSVTPSMNLPAMKCN